MKTFPHLFEPLQIGPMFLPNRIMMTTNGPHMPEDRYLVYVEERARSGIAIMGTPAGHGIYQFPFSRGPFNRASVGEFDAVYPSPVSSEGRAYYDETVTPLLRKRAETAHRHGVAIVGQLYHPGASRSTDNLQPAIGPSRFQDEHLPEAPHVLDEAEIGELVETYANGARRVKDAGLDGAEIHAAHGYLIEQFLSPFSNKRTDRYGGSLDNRMRFLLEIIDAIRAQVGPDFPVGIRTIGDELVDGGLTVEEMTAICRKLSGLLTYINISGGTHSGLIGGAKPAYVSPWFVAPGLNVPMAAAIKKAVDIPVIVGGRINDPEQAERILAEGSADMVGMVRALIADPDFIIKARDGRAHEIRKCIANNECHALHDAQRPIRCAVNAAATQEDRLSIEPTETRKRVLVVGGGPAGMEAARVAAERGHQVSLYEKGESLGGTLNVITRDPDRRNMADFTRYLEGQLERLGVVVHTGVEMIPETVVEQAPDAVVVAVGAVPFVPALPGLDGGNVVTAVDVLLGTARVGNRVVVVAGLEEHLPPLSIAGFLAGKGKQVEVISEMLVAGHGIEMRTLHPLTRRLLEQGVALTPLTKLKAVEGDALLVANSYTYEERRIEGVDTVVLACGGEAAIGLAAELKGRVPELFSIGDCLAPRRLIHAVVDGFRVGRLL